MTKLDEIRERHNRLPTFMRHWADKFTPFAAARIGVVHDDRETLLQTIDTLQAAIKARHEAGCCDCEYTDRTGCDRTWYCFDPLCALLPPENPND